jgi:hypothetical protein
MERRLHSFSASVSQSEWMGAVSATSQPRCPLVPSGQFAELPWLAHAVDMASLHYETIQFVITAGMPKYFQFAVWPRVEATRRASWLKRCRSRLAFERSLVPISAATPTILIDPLRGSSSDLEGRSGIVP